MKEYELAKEIADYYCYKFTEAFMYEGGMIERDSMSTMVFNYMEAMGYLEDMGNGWYRVTWK